MRRRSACATAAVARSCNRLRVIGLVLALLLAPSVPAAADIVSYAIVQPDASLKVQGKTIRLFGVYVPRTERGCLTVIRPIRCGSRAVQALELKIEGFVRCQPQVRYTDGSLGAYCYVRGEGSILEPHVDLGAWLIAQGWAVALPEAPFEYHTLERIARTRGQGVWGFQVDSIR